MSRQFYVKDKIPGLCSTCDNSTVIEFESGKILVRCAALEAKVSEPVHHCGSYFPANSTRSWKLEEVATLLIQNKTGSIGFLRPGTEEHAKAKHSRHYD